MIKTIELTKIFRTEEVETTALNKVNLEIKSGAFVTIMGPSGCGKSTLLNIVGLLDNPTDGKYFFEGIEVSKLKERHRTDLRKGKLGFVFQSFNLIDELNVYENVELPLVYLKLGAAKRRQLVDTVLERMKIGHRRKHFPQQLSGGQQQRVAIARAVVANPKLILADEPTGNLDTKSANDIISIFCQLNRDGITVVLVTHEMNIAERAKRVVRLLDGQIIEDRQTGAKTCDEPGSPVVKP